MEHNQGPLPFQVVKGRTPEELTRELAEAAAFGYVPMAGGMINRNGEVWVITVLEDEMGHHDSVEQRFEEEVRAAERRAEQEIEEARRRADAIRGGERSARRPERASATAVARPVPGRFSGRLCDVTGTGRVRIDIRSPAVAKEDALCCVRIVRGHDVVVAAGPRDRTRLIEGAPESQRNLIGVRWAD